MRRTLNEQIYLFDEKKFIDRYLLSEVGATHPYLAKKACEKQNSQVFLCHRIRS